MRRSGREQDHITRYTFPPVTSSDSRVDPSRCHHSVSPSSRAAGPDAAAAAAPPASSHRHSDLHRPPADAVPLPFPVPVPFLSPTLPSSLPTRPPHLFSPSPPSYPAILHTILLAPESLRAPLGHRPLLGGRRFRCGGFVKRLGLLVQGGWILRLMSWS